MHSLRRQLLLNGLELFDLLALGTAFLVGVAAYSQRLQFNLGEVLALRLKVSNVVLMLAFLSVCHVVLRANGLYESRRLSTLRAEFGDILKAVTFCALLLSAAAVVFKIEVVTGRSFLIAFGVTSAAMLVGSRVVLRHTLAQLRRRGRNLRRVLIVGTNRRAAQMARRIESKPELGYELLGFADDPWPGLYALKMLGYSVRTDLQDLSQFLRENVVDEVLICLPLKSYYDRIREIIERCESQGIIIRLMGRVFDLRIAHATAETLEGEIVVSVCVGRMEGWPVLAKRVLDIAGSLVLLVLTAPIFLLAGAAIKVTSHGPVFFIQERVGINKRRFRVLKFRTMAVDAEHRQRHLEALNEVGGPVFKIRNDPRITRIGRLLRKASIDELPQLINVLKGDMSLVGPRPLPVRDYRGFDQDWHRRRFSVRPGITCLWQVNGRSRLSFDRWMELDMQYIDQWSLWLDLKILVKTVPAVLKGSGAA